MRIVCDTNILISALVFPGGAPDAVLNLVRLHEVTLCLSTAILSEFRRVMVEKFEYRGPEADLFVEQLQVMAEMFHPTHRLRVITRVDADNRILEAAEAAHAEFIVTGDKRDLLPLKRVGMTRIVTARDFLEYVTSR